MSELLGFYLVKGGNIEQWQLDLALEKQENEGGKLGEVLIRMGYLENNSVLKALDQQADDVVE